jgi:glyoxylase-like metal-dependent hydrolase (beta-lactamase superfamily II)
MKQSDDNKFIPMTSVASGHGKEIANDLYYYTNQFVNVIFFGEANKPGWVLIDAGMPKSSDELIKVAEKRFGANNPPSAIILTHGHFDHVGSIVGLLGKWPVPVYAHELEFPFLNGEESYPEPDPTVEGGMLAKISFIYPNKPIDISVALKPLPNDKTVPFMGGWEWIHTPGHTPGHVSFFRKKDRLMIAGDAFVTVRADSFYRVLMQKPEINGPPSYLTTDWPAAKASVRKLAALDPETVITGHGPAMSGEELKKGLRELAEDFEEMAIPAHGRYVEKAE